MLKSYITQAITAVPINCSLKICPYDTVPIYTVLSLGTFLNVNIWPAAIVPYNDFTKFTFNKELSAMIGNSVDYKITKRFGMTGAHRVMVPSTGKPMHFILIGSRVTL